MQRGFKYPFSIATFIRDIVETGIWDRKKWSLPTVQMFLLLLPEKDADHGEYHCQSYLCYVFLLVSCRKTMKSYDNILCNFWQGNYASATFIPHVFLPVATYHKMIKSYQNVFCWFDSTIMLQHCTFGLYSVEIASYHLNELCKCQKDLADNQ